MPVSTVSVLSGTLVADISRGDPAKAVALTSSWRIESEADIDAVLETLRRNLKAQLEEDTIINVEF